MKRFIDKVLTTFFFAGVMLILASCVKEEFVDCLPDVRLLIKTDHDNGKWGTRADTRAKDVDSWYNCIDSIDVYIFDENEKFVTLWEGGPYISGQDYEVPLKELRLSEGVYTFVAWTDPGHHYVSNLDELMGMIEPGEGEEGEPGTGPTAPDFSLDDMRMRINLDTLVNGSGAIEEDLMHRHHGIQKTYVSNNSILDPGPYTIELAPSLHKVNFTVRGLPPEVMGDDYALSVIDRNSSHTFRNAYVPNLEPYRHRRVLTAPVIEEPETRADQPTSLVTSMYLMQLQDGTTTNFELHNTTNDNLVREGDLVKLMKNVYLANNQPLNFEETLEFDVELSFVTNARIEVVINGWKYIWTPEELDW